MNEKFSRIFVLFLIFILIFNAQSFASDFSPEIQAEGAVLIDEESGAVLFDKNKDKKLFPASTTKVMTAILAIENAQANNSFDALVKADEEIIVNTYGSHIALDYDEEMSVDNLLHALLIASANDSALALAKYTSDSIDDFVELMNEKAKELGAENTHFANPHGLHDDNHYTTPYDLYLITNYAMENDYFRKLVSMDSYIIPPTNKKEEERLIHNTNKFLYGNGKIQIGEQWLNIKYDGINGVKTGFTNEAMNCLISHCRKDGRGLYTVVLKSEGTQVYADTMQLLDHGYNDFRYDNIASKEQFIDNISIPKGDMPVVAGVLDRDISYPVKISKDNGDIKQVIDIDKDLEAPIKKDDIIGTISYYDNDQLIQTGNIISTMDVKRVDTNILSTIKSNWYIVIILLYIIMRTLQIFGRYRRRKSRNRNKYN